MGHIVSCYNKPQIIPFVVDSDVYKHYAVLQKEIIIMILLENKPIFQSLRVSF